MACDNPQLWYRIHGVNTELGKGKWFRVAYPTEQQFYNWCDSPGVSRAKFPCRKCLGCRIDKTKDDSVRAVHHDSMFKQSSFITLTYAPFSLPSGGSLDPEDWDKFVFRFRAFLRKYHSRKVQFLMCGEYGENLSRPHYHALVFGWDFRKPTKSHAFDYPGRYLWKKSNGFSLYRSDLLEHCWMHGQCLVGDVTRESAAYVSRYVMKKLYGPEADDHYRGINEYGEEVQKVREFMRYPSRPALGASWLKKFSGDILSKNYVTLEGKEYRTPPYYSRKLSVEFPQEMGRFKALGQKRVRELERAHPEEFTVERLAVKARKRALDFEKLIRGFENGT